MEEYSVYGNQRCFKLLEEYDEYQGFYRLKQYHKCLEKKSY